MEVLLLEFVTLELFGGDGSASRRSRFTPEERASAYVWVEGWVGLTGGLIFVEKSTISAIAGNRILISHFSSP